MPSPPPNTTSNFHITSNMPPTTVQPPDISGIMGYLQVLGLNPSRMPTLKEYKKAFREKLQLHPDLGGDTSQFQEITEAARNIFDFISSHAHQQHRKETENDKDLLKTFESTNNVTYHPGNIVFNIDGAKADLWIECLRRRVSDPVPLSDGSGVQMKRDDFKIALVTYTNKADFGSIMITVYPHPKNSSPKIMIQGKMYMAFVSFIIPLVLKDMQAAAKLTLTTDTLAADTDEDYDASDDPIENKDLEILYEAFKRMEHEVITIRKDLVDRVDIALINKDAPNTTQLEERMDKIEDLLKTNLNQYTTLSDNIKELNVTLKNNPTSGTHSLTNIQVDQLAQDMMKHPNFNDLSSKLDTLRSEVAKATTLELVQKGVVDMSTTLADTHTNTQKISDSITELSQKTHDTNVAAAKEMTQIRKNSDNSLVMFESMTSSLEKIALGNPIQARTTSTPNQQPTQPPTLPTPETRNRKGILFCSSVAQNIDTQRFKQELNCDLKVISTNYIEHHPSDQDPDAYLHCMVNQHANQEYDFAIIATGSKDITEMDTENASQTTLFQETKEQAELLCKIAQNMTTELSLD